MCLKVGKTMPFSPARWLRSRRMKVVQPFGKSTPGSGLRLSLCDINAGMTDAWLDCFFGVESVAILQGDLLEADVDAIVSPANSFGDMSGGVDKRIDDFHKGAAQRAVVEAIAERFYGELPVGMALVVELPSRRLPFLVASPTMRVPSRIAGTINAYLAMRAAFVATLRHNAGSAKRIESLGVPGLGTGVGGMDPDDAALQMRAAHDSVIGDDWRRVIHPAMAPFVLRRGPGGAP